MPFLGKAKVKWSPGCPLLISVFLHRLCPRYCSETHCSLCAYQQELVSWLYWSSCPCSNVKLKRLYHIDLTTWSKEPSLIHESLKLGFCPKKVEMGNSRCHPQSLSQLPPNRSSLSDKKGFWKDCHHQQELELSGQQHWCRSHPWISGSCSSFSQPRCLIFISRLGDRIRSPGYVKGVMTVTIAFFVPRTFMKPPLLRAIFSSHLLFPKEYSISADDPVSRLWFRDLERSHWRNRGEINHSLCIPWWVICQRTFKCKNRSTLCTK